MCEESLSEVAISIKLGEYMLLGKGEEATGEENEYLFLLMLLKQL